jgi:hypothetical protein
LIGDGDVSTDANAKCYAVGWSYNESVGICVDSSDGTTVLGGPASAVLTDIADALGCRAACMTDSNCNSYSYTAASKVC